MDELIEKLKKNREPFGLLSPEEQKCFRKTGKKNCLCYTDADKWEDAADCQYQSSATYAIKPDYQPEVDLEIEECVDGFLGVSRLNEESFLPFEFTHLHCLPSLPGFVGFFCEKNNPVRFDEVAKAIRNGWKIFAIFRK